MAEPITKQQLIDASQDAETLENVVNGDNASNVTSRQGRVYPTIAKALYQVIQTGGFEPFLTQSALLASVPTVPKKAAIAFDTGKIWFWNGAWSYSGWGPSLSLKPSLTTEDLNTVLEIGIHQQELDSNSTLARNYPVQEAGFLITVSSNGLYSQKYSTWKGRQFWREKYLGNPWQAWKEYLSVAHFEENALIIRPNLTIEDLNTVLEIGIHRQQSNVEATLARNYPENQASGTLVVTSKGQLTTQEYTTWQGNKYFRTKYASFNFVAWNKIATQAQIDLTISRKANLSTENLNDVLALGFYRQINDANATLANNYPDTRAGTLVVVDGAGLLIQEYTTWFGRKFWRTKQGSFSWQAWQEVASVASINTPYKGKNIAWFGDSIVEGNSHPNRIATLLGATVSKFGFASHTMSKYINSPLGRDKGSMYQFAKAINTGNWTDVIAGGEWVRDNLSDDNMPQINAMVATDWTKVDYIVIAFGTNDIYSTTPLGELTDTADATGATFVGATKYIIEAIQDKYPHIQIMFITPTFRTRWFQTPNPDRPEQNSDTLLDPQGKKYTDYIDALLHMKNLYHVPVFDFYRTSGINIRTWSHYLSDGVHPKENGIQLWTKKISAFMLSN